MRRGPRLGGNVATPLAVFYVVLWASAYVPSKIGATAMPPLWFLVARFLAAGLATATERVREGTTLSAALEGVKVFPRMALEMLAVGEETGSLDAMLRDVAELYEGDLDQRLSQLTTWIEPVLLLIMGLVVGAIVVIMYLPVFEMAGTVR